MFAKGIIDPAKVTRSALQNAVSIASMVLTTESLITDIPEKASAMPPGGMGGMGGMGGGGGGAGAPAMHAAGAGGGGWGGAPRAQPGRRGRGVGGCPPLFPCVG